ncbi:hypothetical protein GCM10027051_20140 [Niabella terrae]
MTRLYTKQALFSSASTLVIIALFVLLLPELMQRIAFNNTNKALRKQEAKVMDEIRRNGVDYYLNGDTAYGSYSMLKDEYISLERIDRPIAALMVTDQRLIERDTITYRILTHSFQESNAIYLLEIGKKMASINEEGRALQRVAIYVLLPLILLLLLVHLLYNRYLLKPLNLIIKSRLLDARFPFKQRHQPLKTTTTDFRYLDRSINDLMQQIRTAFEKEREFTANASHELLTPLSIIQSKIENLLNDETITTAQAMELEGLMRTLYRVKKIVNSLLLIARVENEQYVRNDTIFSIDFINEITEELEHRLKENDLQLQMKMKSSTKLTQINKELLFQLFYNIIANAIRYNRFNGMIEITDGRTSGGQYYITVRDTGIGIAADQQLSIFDRFKKSGVKSDQSNGLGLSIVKSIAQYHDLQISLSSSLDQGSSFRITFALKHLDPDK